MEFAGRWVYSIGSLTIPNPTKVGEESFPTPVYLANMTNRMYYYVYIMSSITRVIYVGFTNSLMIRGHKHKNGFYENSFSKKYKTNRLVYWEHFFDKDTATRREQEIKKWRREKKVALINKVNPDWCDLYKDAVLLSTRVINTK